MATDGPARPPGNDPYDELMVSIGSAVFDLQIVMMNFMVKIMAEFHDDLAIDLPVRVFTGLEYESLHARRIFFDSADELLKLELRDRPEALIVSDLDVGTQEQLAHYLHDRYRSDRIYAALSRNEDVH